MPCAVNWINPKTLSIEQQSFENQKGEIQHWSTEGNVLNCNKDNLIKTNVWNLTLILVKKKESNIKIRRQIFICDLVLFTFKNGCLTKPKYYKIHMMIRFTVAIYLPINLPVLMATPLKQFINPFVFSLLTSTRENLTPMFCPILWCLEHCDKNLL